MSVHKDHKRNTWYFVVRIDGKQYKRRNKDWTLKRHAVEAEREFLTDYNKGNTVLSTDTFKEVSDKYLKYVELNRKDSTIRNIRNTLKKHVLPFFGDKQVSNIKLEDIETFQNAILNTTYMRNGKKVQYSNSHIAYIQNITNAVFKYAVRHRVILYNPFDRVETAQKQTPDIKREITIITQEEFNNFIDQIEDITEKALYSVFFWCGLRSGEALGLNIEDYNKQDKTLNIYKSYSNHEQLITSTKTGNNRIVDVPIQCATLIEELIDSYSKFDYKGSFPLFGFTQRLSKTTLTRKKNEYIKQANVPYFTFHELRHTHVSTLIQLGMRDIDIAKRLGHSVAMVNETYGHLFAADREKLINKLNNMSK